MRNRWVVVSEGGDTKKPSIHAGLRGLVSVGIRLVSVLRGVGISGITSLYKVIP
jgi:hypothetical protein